MNTKTARLCYNSANWQHPTGLRGKSTSNDTFEYSKGFGFEEWLNFEVEHDGYCYGFIQNTNGFETMPNHKYDRFILFTYYEGHWYRVGYITQPEAITDEQAKAAIDANPDKIAEMIKHLKEYTDKEVEYEGRVISPSQYLLEILFRIQRNEISPRNIFNIRFLKGNLHIHFEETICDEINRSFRYNLLDNKCNFY